MIIRVNNPVEVEPDHSKNLRPLFFLFSRILPEEKGKKTTNRIVVEVAFRMEFI